MDTLQKTFAHTNHSGKLNPVALIVDIQSFDGMDRSDAIAYKNALVNDLDELRRKNIPIVWIGIANGPVKLLPPQIQSDPSARRHREELEEMGFTIFHSDHSNHDVYKEFLTQHGPRNEDIIYRKPSMSALAEECDIDRQEYILEEAGIKLASQKNENDHPDTVYIDASQIDSEFEKLFSGQQTLADYLRQNSINQTIILGAVSYYCVTKTAEDALRKGFNPVIASDRVLSWEYKVETSFQREQAKLVWGAEEGLISPFNHAALIAAKSAMPLNLLPMRQTLDRLKYDTLGGEVSKPAVG